MTIENERMGKFYISHNDVYGGKAASVLAKMSFAPLRVEFLAYQNNFEYIGISPMFKKVPLGQLIPKYNIIVNDLGDEISVSAQISKDT